MSLSGDAISSAADTLKPVRPETIIFPHEKYRLRDVEAYYRFVAPLLLPHLERRPLTLVLCPNNIKACRYKKHATGLPAPVIPISIPGHREPYIMVDTLEGVLALVRVGLVELHTWGCRYEYLEYPDRLVFDLDPPEGLPWERLAEAVLLVRNRLLDRGLDSFLKTSGGKGYHVVVPLVPAAAWSVVTPFSRQLAEDLAAEHPGRLTARLHRDRSGPEIFIDWIRNGRGTNVAEAYSLRARHGAPVSVPITWEELVAGVRPDAFGAADIPERLARIETDPWKGYGEIRQTLPV
jgi:bifunctional non-homologous end joining protein LigD